MPETPTLPQPRCPHCAEPLPQPDVWTRPEPVLGLYQCVLFVCPQCQAVIGAQLVRALT
jgi:hypothetical protein